MLMHTQVVLVPVMLEAVIEGHERPVTPLMLAWEALGVLLDMLSADVLASNFYAVEAAWKGGFWVVWATRPQTPRLTGSSWSATLSRM